MANRELAKGMEKVYERSDTDGGEKDSSRLDRQRDQAGKDVQQLRMVRDGIGVFN